MDDFTKHLVEFLDQLTDQILAEVAENYRVRAENMRLRTIILTKGGDEARESLAALDEATWAAAEGYHYEEESDAGVEGPDEGFE